MKIYNSLSRKKESFRPISNRNIGIYVCGPTVYNHLHLGNYRTLIIFDVIVRYFIHLGYKVRYVRNITDVGHLEDNENNSEDKIIKRSKIEKIEPMEVVQKYTLSFHNFLRILNIISPNIEPTATGHIIEQIEFIKKLIDKKFAYEINGSVYFDLKKYMKVYDYGILSNNKIDELLINKKNKIFYKEKKFYYDFCLWKKAENQHIMNWNSPWSNGYPGWHTECITMSTKYLGNKFDIHGGGIDLKFPHHECELAQANGFYHNSINPNNGFVRYWVHINMLNIDGKKMSKSLNNSLNLKNILYKEISSPNVFKLFILQSHYRNIIDFSLKKLKDTEKNYIKIQNSIKKLNNFNPKNNFDKNQSNFNVPQWISKCYKSMNDDFNTPLLISQLLKVSNFINTDEINNMKNSEFFLLKKYMNYFIFDILGFSKIQQKSSNDESKKLDFIVQKLILFRKEMRNQKNWVISDRIRKELNYIGILIKDDKLL